MGRDASSSDIAAQLGIASATIQRYARDGRIPFSVTPGGHRRFDIDEVRKALGSPAISDGPEVPHEASAVILTALGVEFEAVISHLPNRESRRLSNGTRYYVGSVAGRSLDWTLAVAEIGEGNLTAAAEATRAIDHFRPDIVMFVGVAGSLKPDVVHGTVVVANKVYRYHSGKAAEDFLSRPMVFPTWHGLEQLVREVRQTGWTATSPKPLVELKPIAAGEVVVASKASETFHLIHERCNDAVAVDMESAGMYEAAHRAGGIATLAVRGISDMIDDKSPTVDADWQAVAARNAAAFTFALLDAAHPGDLGIMPPPNPFSTERAELLGRIPPTAAVALERCLNKPGPALQILREMVKSDQPPESTARALARQTLVAADDSLSADLSVAIGEYAASFGENDAASVAFESAANARKDGASHWLARAALSAGASGNRGRANRLISDALAAAQDDHETQFVHVLSAAVSEDAKAVVDTARSYGLGDGLVDLLHARALAVLGATEEAIGLAFRALSEHPNRSLTGGVALEAARLLLERSRHSGPGLNTVADVDRARQLALEVRDLRREWGGPSEEAAVVAVAAAGLAHDFEAAIRIAQMPPSGEATEQEAGHDELRILAANAALMAGLVDRARSIASTIDDRAERSLIEADCAKLSGAEPPVVATILRDALAAATVSHQRFRAYMGLASAGTWPLDGIEILEKEDPDAAEMVRATAEISLGDLGKGARRLRKLGTEQATALMVNAYVKDGRIDDAVETLEDAANRYSRPHLRLQAAMVLASAGQYERALAVASATLLVIPPGSHLHGELRRLCLELASRLRQWTIVIEHARAAISESSTDLALRWSLICGLFNVRQIQTARQEMLAMQLTPRDEGEARLAIELIRSGTPDANDVARILDIAERFTGSEEVARTAFGAVMEMTHDLTLSPSTGDRIRQLTDSYFERWPESTTLARIDVTDPNVLISELRERIAPTAEALEKFAADVVLGRLPYGFLTSLRGRSLAEALITRALGCIPIGTIDRGAIREEDEVASQALEGHVVADTHALYTVGHTGWDPAALIARFSRVFVPRQTLDDVLGASNSLRMPTSGSMGWDVRSGRPYFTETNKESAVAWRDEAEKMVDRLRLCQVVDGVSVGLNEDPGAEVILGPLELARREGCPLWSDDPAIRGVARNEGIPVFGTLGLLKALQDAGDLSDTEVDECLVSLMRVHAVDLPVRPDLTLHLAEEEGWVGKAAAQVLTRPIVWGEPESALTLYRTCVHECHAAAPGSLANWSLAAGLGACRAILPHVRQGALASLVLSGFFQTGSDPRALGPLLHGARLAAAAVAIDDPLTHVARLLRDGLLAEIGPQATPQAFAHMIGGLDQEDRVAALEEFLRATS